jgi:hypothetical protein
MQLHRVESIGSTRPTAFLNELDVGADTIAALDAMTELVEDPGIQVDVGERVGRVDVPESG